MKTATNNLRHQVIGVYKQLLYMGREYPLGYEYFRDRLKRAFFANKHLKTDTEIKEALEKAEYVKKEIEALYYLKKYRDLKRKYYK